MQLARGELLEEVRLLVEASIEHQIEVACRPCLSAIVAERPRFNRQGRWADRTAWTVEDYRDYYDEETKAKVAEFI